MKLTHTESRVVDRLRKTRVDTMHQLCQHLQVSHMSVVRALKKYGYFTSVNHNARYYTLHDIARFDEDGLWTYRDICFSSHHTLSNTLVALVHNAAAGLTVAHLQERLGTQVGNVLSRLCRQNQLTRCFVGRQAIYLAAEPRRQEQQREHVQHQQQTAAAAAAEEAGRSPPFPAHCDVVLVLEVLIQIIKAPRAEAAELAKAIRARGVKINVRQVQRVLDFYGIQKKTTHSP